MAELVSIYARLVGSRVRAQLQYRTSLTLDILAAFAVGFIDLITILVLFEHLTSMGGFSVEEVAFLFGLSMVAFNLVELVMGQLDELPRMIRMGQLDTYLVRPLGSLFQVLSSDFALRRLGRIAQGAIVLGVAIARLPIEWTLGRVLMMPLSVLTAAAIFSGVWIAAVCISFWFVDAREVANAFTYGGNFLTQYPLSIFSAWIRRVFVFIIPMAFVVYFPSLYILGKADPLGLPHALRFIAPAVALASWAAATSVWRIALRHYRSTGS